MRISPYEYYLLSNYYVQSTQFPVGTYTISPAFKIDNTWIDIKTNPNQKTRYLTTVNDTVITFKPIVSTSSVKAISLEAGDTLCLGECNIVKAIL